MLALLIFNIYLLNFFKCEKIELEDFEIESNELYPLTKLIYNNYSLDTPIKRCFDFSLKTNLENIINSKKNEDNYLFYFYFILSNPSLSISDTERFCKYGLVGKESTNSDKISFLKKYELFQNNSILLENNNINNTLNNIEKGIKEEFLFNEIGVKQFYLYFCSLEKKQRK